MLNSPHVWLHSWRHHWPRRASCHGALPWSLRLFIQRGHLLLPSIVGPGAGVLLVMVLCLGTFGCSFKVDTFFYLPPLAQARVLDTASCHGALPQYLWQFIQHEHLLLWAVHSQRVVRSTDFSLQQLWLDTPVKIYLFFSFFIFFLLLYLLFFSSFFSFFHFLSFFLFLSFFFFFVFCCTDIIVLVDRV